LSTGDNIQERSKNFAETLELMVQSHGVPSLNRLRGEIIPTYGLDGEPVMHIDRAGSILFGTVMYGIQLLAYTNTENGTRYWVPRRANSVRAYAGMLDHCAGGALNSGETPMDTLAREASEEASLSEEFVRAHAKSFGVVSYHMAHNANNEEGHQPQVMYTYSIELPQDMVPKPSDGEVEKFELMNLEQVKAALANREFKANCVLTWISYLISQGIINADNEPDLHKITTHLHRRLDFPAR
jgi:8-oxo-dGTP pyrophosphatase MutT (NUDIX family)